MKIEQEWFFATEAAIIKVMGRDMADCFTREITDAALSAAAPMIRAHVLEEAADTFDRLDGLRVMWNAAGIAKIIRALATERVST